MPAPRGNLWDHFLDSGQYYGNNKSHHAAICRGCLAVNLRHLKEGEGHLILSANPSTGPQILSEQGASDLPCIPNMY